MDWVWKGEREAQCRVQWIGFGKGRESANVEFSGLGLDFGKGRERHNVEISGLGLEREDPTESEKDMRERSSNSNPEPSLSQA